MALDGTRPAPPSTLYRDRSTTDDVIAIEGGRIVTPAGTIEGGSVVIQGNRIDRIRTEPSPLADRVIDATNRVVIPGIVDVHGDDVEHQLVPRSGATIDPRTAFIAADRSNITQGITTKAHALAFENPDAGHRSPEMARSLLETLADTHTLLGSNVAHTRFELSAVTPAAIADIFAYDHVVLASLMHHRPGEGQYESSQDFHTRYSADAGLGDDSADEIAQARCVAGDAWSDTAPQIIEQAKKENVPVACHDAEDADAVDRAVSTGVDICEFPLTEEAAIRASEVDVPTVMGAPNLVRGESLFDNLEVSSAITANCCDVLCADYHPPSLLQSIFVDTGEPLHEKVRRVTDIPARLLKMTDRGRIAAGARADLVIVNPHPVPCPTDVFVGGHQIIANRE